MAMLGVSTNRLTHKQYFYVLCVYFFDVCSSHCTIQLIHVQSYEYVMCIIFFEVLCCIVRSLYAFSSLCLTMTDTLLCVCFFCIFCFFCFALLGKLEQYFTVMKKSLVTAVFLCQFRRWTIGTGTALVDQKTKVGFSVQISSRWYSGSNQYAPTEHTFFLSSTSTLTVTKSKTKRLNTLTVRNKQTKTDKMFTKLNLIWDCTH